MMAEHDPAEVDFVAKALCRCFYADGTIYDATVEEVIEIRWREWRERAIAAIDAVKEYRANSSDERTKDTPE